MGSQSISGIPNDVINYRMKVCFISDESHELRLTFVSDNDSLTAEFGRRSTLYCLGLASLNCSDRTFQLNCLVATFDHNS
jgi:hypothetical protein